jgi:hypothetical protein
VAFFGEYNSFVKVLAVSKNYFENFLYVLYTVFLLINAPGRLFFDHFLKKLFNKNAINSHYSFFSPYKGLRGAFIRRNTMYELFIDYFRLSL